MKKSHACSFPDVDKYVRKRFEQYCVKGVPISNLILQKKKKAEDFVKEFRLDSFKASNSWLESFKTRDGIAF